MSSVSTELLPALHEVFGFSEFRALQEDAVRAAVEGRDVLVVMPTGAGKSLCYQLPAALTPGVTLVVSPLVALMRDQVSALQARTSFGPNGVAYLNSLQTSSEQFEILDALGEGRLRLIYVAPERFRSQAFLEALRGMRLARFVVDEAHCISEWGHDFRPDYLRLREILPTLGTPPLMAVTATATRRVQDSIVRNLGMREPEILVGGFNRPNLHYSVKRCRTDIEREELLGRALPKLAAMGGSGLIYAPTRKMCQRFGEIAMRVLAQQGKRAGVYHAGLEASYRNLMQQSWIEGETHTLVATNAFGMGIDKPDVRFVVHAGYPDSPESYYQEAGRAGRDGRKSRCVVLTSPGDRRLREYLIDNDALTAIDVKNAFQGLVAQAVEGVAQVPRIWWKQQFDWNDTKVRLTLAELERRGLIERLNERPDTQSLRLLRRDFPPEIFKLITQDIDRQREERYRRLDEMLAYCRTATCRRQMMLDYFGDIESTPHDGFCCDNCENPPAAPVIQSSAPKGRVNFPADFDRQSIHHILQSLDALWPTVGKAKLNQILRGANSKTLEKFRAGSCPLFGALRGSSREAVETFLGRLIEHGLLHQGDEDEYFVCRVTSAGREAWQTQAPLDIALPGAPRVASAANRNGTPPSRNGASGDGEDDKVFEKLRNWRWAQAQSENVPPYCVLTDRSLHDIARLLPQDTVELLAVVGIGDAKLQKYGAAVLGVLSGAVALPAEMPRQPVAVKSALSAPQIAKPVVPRETAPQNSPNSVEDTYLLLQEGRSVEEIAGAHGLKVSVIWGQLATLIQDEFLDADALEALIPGEVRSRVEKALDEATEEGGLRPVWEALGGQIDYGLIRCVAACHNLARG